MIKVLLADDHTVFREGVRSLFDSEKEYEIVVQAGDGKEVLTFLKSHEIDLVLMDISMPILDGVATTEIIKKEFPNVKVIMLTMHDTQNYISKMLAVGVDGYLLKTTTRSQLFEAIDKVMLGQKYYGQEVQQIFMDSFNSDRVVDEVKLTRREKEILVLICEELNTNEIAEKLFISTYTVESHRKNLMSKIGAKNLAGLVKFGINNKFI